MSPFWKPWEKEAEVSALTSEVQPGLPLPHLDLKRSGRVRGKVERDLPI